MTNTPKELPQAHPDKRYKGIVSETPLYVALTHYITGLAGPGKSMEVKFSQDMATTEVRLHNGVRFIHTCRIPQPIFEEEPVLAQEALYVIGAKDNSDVRFILKSAGEKPDMSREIYSECSLHGIDDTRVKLLYGQIDRIYQRAEKRTAVSPELLEEIDVEIDVDETAFIYSSRAKSEDGEDRLVIDVELPTSNPVAREEEPRLIEYGALDQIMDDAPIMLTHRKLPAGVSVATLDELARGREENECLQRVETVMMQTLVACYNDLSTIQYDKFVSVHPHRNMAFDFGAKSQFEPYTRFSDMPLTDSETWSMTFRMEKVLKRDDVNLPDYLAKSGRLLVEMLKFCQHNRGKILVYEFDELDPDTMARSLFTESGNVAFYAQQIGLLKNIMHQGLVQRGDVPFADMVSIADCRLVIRGMNLRFVGPGVKHEFKTFFRDAERVNAAGTADYELGVLRHNDRPKEKAPKVLGAMRLTKPADTRERTLDEIITSYLSEADEPE